MEWGAPVLTQVSASSFPSQMVICPNLVNHVNRVGSCEGYLIATANNPVLGFDSLR